MANNPGNPEPVRFLTPREERIHRRLGLVGEGPQAFYRDALRLLKDGTIVESTSHLVGHLLREIESSLRDVLEPIAHYGAQVVKGKASDVHEQEVRIILRELGLSEVDGAGAAWIEVARSGLHGLAHRRSLDRPRPFDEYFRELWDEVETILDVVLERFESRYLDLHDEADRLLAKPVPSKADLKYLKDYLPNNPVTRHYFFANLQHEGWLRPLAEAGFFSAPPSAVRDERAGTITFPQWPVTSYLDRIATVPEQQNHVVEILLDVPETDNACIHDALTAIALKLAAPLAVRLVDRVAGWMPSSRFSLLAEKAGELSAKLAAGGHVAEGFSLLRRVLDPKRLADHANVWNSHEAYEYGEVLKRHIPEFSTRWPYETLTLVCDLLDQAMPSGDADSDARFDSYLWRRSIESSRPGRRYELLDMLVNAVRDTAVAIVQADQSQGQTVVGSLEARGPAIFRRIALHVLVTFPQAAPEYLESRMRRRELFDRWIQEREYVRLLAVAFDRVSIEARDEILSWIEAGPDLSEYEAKTPADVARIRASWQRSRLKPLRGKLPKMWEERLRTFEESRPTDDETDLDEGAVWVGPTSPRSAEDLKGLNIEDLVGFLKSWTPKSGWREFSPEGLGRALTTVVAETPARYADEAEVFEGLQPTYVRAVLQGFEEALKNSRSFSWVSVLKLCEWVVNQPRPDETGRSDWGQDPGWSWSRKAVASLIAAGADSPANSIPFDSRDQIWRVIEPITWDPDPSAERDAGRDTDDAYQVAINSVRGEAMIAAIRYAVWLEKNLRRTAVERTGMDAMPDVRRCVEEHLDMKHEASPAVRAVLGEGFPVLHWIDSDWASKTVGLVFPEAEDKSSLLNAAWSTYLRFQQPWGDVFPVLARLYEKAVNELNATDEHTLDHDSVEHSLGTHLMSFYWRGLPNSTELTRLFFQKAGSGLRRAALDFVGRSLWNSDEGIPPAVLARFRELWEWRFEQAKDTNGMNNELEPFGWWLASGKFDPDWAVEQGLRVLRTGKSLEPDHLVVEYLVTLAQTRPLAAVQIVEGLIENLREHWSFYGWRDGARDLLKAVLASNDNQALVLARAVVNKLAARGHLEFRDLLRPPNDPGAAAHESART